MELTARELDHCMYLCSRSKSKDHKTDLNNVELFDFNDVDGMVGDRDGVLYVIFTGSDDFSNWIDNFKFWKRPYKKVVPYEGVSTSIRVHSGFINAYKKAREYVLNKAKGFDKVICTGHSLGGVLSVLAALDIQYNQNPDLACVQFAGPRPGNSYFMKSFNNRVKNCYRFKYGNDIVTKLPPPLFCYSHVGKFFQLGKKKWWKIFGSITDHFPTNYIKSMNKFEL